MCYVVANIEDESGTPQPLADDEITFAIDGPGTIAAVDNGDVTSHEAFQANHRHAYHGRCVAIVRAAAPSGTITLTASCPGLTNGIATIEAKAEK
jgi:beta-galactosidase